MDLETVGLVVQGHPYKGSLICTKQPNKGSIRLPQVWDLPMLGLLDSELRSSSCLPVSREGLELGALSWRTEPNEMDPVPGLYYVPLRETHCCMVERWFHMCAFDEAVSCSWS